MTPHPRVVRTRFVQAASAAMVVITVIVVAQCAGGQGAEAEETPPPLSKEPMFTLHKPDKELPPEHEVTDRVEVTTSMGSFTIGLFGKSAPQTVNNFLSYVDRGFYSGTVFHRVISRFMIQGGGFTEDLTRLVTDDPVRLEIIPGLKHKPGIVSMARTADLHSVTSQFFVCAVEATQLNGVYAAFGKVEKGYEVVEAIATVPTHSVEKETLPQGVMHDVPSTPVVIESIVRATTQ